MQEIKLDNLWFLIYLQEITSRNQCSMFPLITIWVLVPMLTKFKASIGMIQTYQLTLLIAMSSRPSRQAQTIQNQAAHCVTQDMLYIMAGI